MRSRAWHDMASREQDKRARHRRNIALGLALAGFVVLLYVVSIVKMGG